MAYLRVSEKRSACVQSRRCLILHCPIGLHRIGTLHCPPCSGLISTPAACIRACQVSIPQAVCQSLHLSVFLQWCACWCSGHIVVPARALRLLRNVGFPVLRVKQSGAQGTSERCRWRRMQRRRRRSSGWARIGGRGCSPRARCNTRCCAVV